MKIGVKIGSHYKIGKMEDVIKYAVGLEFDFFELSALDIKNVDFYKALKNRGIGFGIHLPHGFIRGREVALCATLEPYKSKAKFWFEKSTRDAEKIDCDYSIFHPDLPEIPDRKIKFANSRKEAWEQLIKVLKTYSSKIPLLAETMPGRDYFMHDLEESRKLKSLVPVIGYCFDIDHAFEVDRNIQNVINWYNGIADDVKILHVCDYDPEIRSHLPIGEGIIDFEKFFSSIKLRDDQTFILEVLPHSKKSVKKDILSSKAKLEEILERCQK
jgi:sugar phosphate isomerase/epimerase